MRVGHEMQLKLVQFSLTQTRMLHRQQQATRVGENAFIVRGATSNLANYLQASAFHQSMSTAERLIDFI